MTSEMKFSELIIKPSTVPGWPVKACVGLFCIGLLALYLPLGVLGLGLLIYIGLILRVTVPPESYIMPDETVYAPVDGRIISVDESSDGTKTVILQPDLFDSHLHYAPVAGQLEDITWVDGSFKFKALDGFPNHLRARREITWRTKKGHRVEMTQFGDKWCRLIQCFLREGRQTIVSDPAGLALFRGVVMVAFITSAPLNVVPGQRCLAAQTQLGQAL